MKPKLNEHLHTHNQIIDVLSEKSNKKIKYYSLAEFLQKITNEQIDVPYDCEPFVFATGITK